MYAAKTWFVTTFLHVKTQLLLPLLMLVITDPDDVIFVQNLYPTKWDLILIQTIIDLYANMKFF